MGNWSRKWRMASRTPAWRVFRVVALLSIIVGVYVHVPAIFAEPVKSHHLQEDHVLPPKVYLRPNEQLVQQPPNEQLVQQPPNEQLVQQPPNEQLVQQRPNEKLLDYLQRPEVVNLRPEAHMRHLHAQTAGVHYPKPEVVAPSSRERKQEQNIVAQAPREVLFGRKEETLRGAPVGSLAVGEGTEQEKDEAPCAWVPYTRKESMVHYVMVVLERLGYTIRYRNEAFEDCAIIWSYEYPFWKHCWNPDLYHYAVHSLRKHQKLNHFPGIGFVANKASMATFGCTSCPTSFLLPDDNGRFLETAKKHADWTWVIKNRWHRGVKIVKPSEVNLKGPEMFIQRFISNPFLIDGRKFDFSVFVALTSINPIRVYMYDGDWAARFCPQKYHPFDPADTKKYVVYGTDHMPLWEVDVLKKYWDLGYGFKKSIFIHLQKQGYDTDKLERSVHDVIRETFVQKEKRFIQAIRTDFFAQNDTRSLFELVRFDFLIDERLKVYLMEVNMSPNLSAAPGNPRSQLYKNLLHDVFSMVGVGKVIQGRGNHGSHEDYDLTTSPHDIRVFSQECFSPTCRDSCQSEVCHMCPHCLTENNTENLLAAFVEHNNRYGYRRVVPVPFKSPEEARNWSAEEDKDFEELSRENQMMFTWFRGKCAQDVAWCS